MPKTRIIITADKMNTTLNSLKDSGSREDLVTFTVSGTAVAPALAELDTIDNNAYIYTDESNVSQESQSVDGIILPKKAF